MRKINFIFSNLFKLHHDQNGQVLLFTALIILVLVCFVALVVNVGQLVIWRVRMQNAVDSAALAAGTWQARGLNQLQMLNDTHWTLRAGQSFTSWFLMSTDWVCSPVGCSPFPWSVAGQLRSINRGVTAAVRGILASQSAISNSIPAAAYVDAVRLARDNGADSIVPVWPVRNPLSLNVQRRNRPGNQLFYEMPGYYFLGMVRWNDEGFYGGSPEPVTFLATKNEQDKEDVFLLVPGLLRGQTDRARQGLLKPGTGRELTIPTIRTTATAWTRKQPLLRGNTQLSDESRGNSSVWSLDFTTSLSPVVIGGQGVPFH